MPHVYLIMTHLFELLRYRKELNVKSTLAERRLVGCLRKAGLRVKPQTIIGPFIVDVLIPRKMLIVEVDGAIHDKPEIQRYDANRTAYLTRLGFTVMRVRNGDVRKEKTIAEIQSYPDVQGKKSKRCARLIDSLMAKRNRPSGPMASSYVRRWSVDEC